MPEYKLENLRPEEAEALTKEMTAILEKYNAEMGITSQINIMKRVPVEEPVLSPYSPDANNGDQETPPPANA